ncbi:formate dehydrogenase subunit delta [Novosphingobium sp.]|uniref:formate dehydrogenase subunit delta n=1 Tax=Novosphingobium sp. TaxID=1874826 RepID=UPI0025F4DC3E|nr:formate dehydrogenase subunit delta [Novosphingobium sp.]
MEIDRLTYMANQIARNLAPQGEEEAIELTFQHLRDFWDPRMKTAMLGGNRAGLDPIARVAVEKLAELA